MDVSVCEKGHLYSQVDAVPSVFEMPIACPFCRAEAQPRDTFSMVPTVYTHTRTITTQTHRPWMLFPDVCFVEYSDGLQYGSDGRIYRIVWGYPGELRDPAVSN